MTNLAPAHIRSDAEEPYGGGFLLDAGQLRTDTHGCRARVNPLAAAKEDPAPSEASPPHPLTRTATCLPTPMLSAPCGPLSAGQAAAASQLNSARASSCLGQRSHVSQRRDAETLGGGIASEPRHGKGLFACAVAPSPSDFLTRSIEHSTPNRRATAAPDHCTVESQHRNVGGTSSTGEETP